MPEDTIRFVLRRIEAYNRRDLDGMLADWAPDAVIDWSRSRGLEARRVEGLNQIREFTESFLEAFDEARIEVADVVEVRPGVVVVDHITQLRGRDGIEVQARAAWVITISGGLQTSLTLYQTMAEALEATEPSQ